MTKPPRAPLSTGLSRNYDERLFWTIVAVTLIVSLPSKFLYYGAPLALIAAACFVFPLIAWRRLAVILALLLAVTSLSLLFAYASGIGIALPAVLYSVLMMLPLLIFFSFDRRLSVSPALFARLRGFLAWYVIIQAAVCLFEAALVIARTGSLNGDYVSGTLGLLDVFRGAVTISQVFFTFNIFCIVMFLLAGPRTPLILAAAGLGMLSCVIAQSGHQTFFFLVTLFGLALVRGVRPSHLMSSALAIAVIVGLVVAVYPTTIRNAQMWYEKTVANENSPKRRLIADWQTEILSPKTMLLGTGLGQFSSRGALFASGDYLNVSLPGALTGRSDYFTDYVSPQLYRYEEVGESSAIAKPYFSYLSMIAELGLPLTGVFLGLMATAARQAGRIYADPRAPALARGLGRYQWFFVIFLLLNCTIENYLEFTQALCIPILLYGLADGRLATLRARFAPSVAVHTHRPSSVDDISSLPEPG